MPGTGCGAGIPAVDVTEKEIARSHRTGRSGSERGGGATGNERADQDGRGGSAEKRVKEDYYVSVTLARNPSN